MKQRQFVEVDEKVIHDMMDRDVPGAFLRDITVESPDEEPPTEDRKTNPPKPEGKSFAKKKPARDEFREMFLAGGEIKQRSAVYIDSEMHDRIKRYLRTIAPEVSISSYVNDILKRHYATYKDYINDLYNEEVAAFLKRTE